MKEKRDKVDYCNICGRKLQLTWDHVPPKGITNGESIIANTVFAGIPEPSQHMKRFQNGIKYRSICQECNNVRLGENDKIYQDFIIQAKKQIESKLFLKDIVVPVKINRLCRAMVGHMLAAKNSYEAEVVTDQKMRQYVLDETRKLSDLKLYSWIYPYGTIIIARDFVIRGYNVNTHPAGMISGVIASYPIAYVISDEESDCGLDDLGCYTSANIEYVADVRLHFETMFIKGTSVYKPFDWPVNIGDDKRTKAIFAIGGPILQDDSRLGLKG